MTGSPITVQASYKLQSIQVLRALAVLLVALAHSSSQIDAPKLYAKEAGHFGVDIFFVISGFIMVFTTHQKPTNAWRFILNRAVRIVPIYWFYSFALLAISLVDPSVLRGTEFSVSHLFLSLGFVPHENPATGSFSPFLRLGWTLNMEMMFYVIFALSILLSFHRRVFIAGAGLMSLVALGLFATHSDMALPAAIQFWSGNIVLEFLAGMILGHLYFRICFPQIGVLTAAFIIAGCLVASYVLREQAQDNGLRGLFWGGPATAIVFVALCCKPSSQFSVLGKVCARIGDASYTIYLSHLFFFSFLRVVWQKMGLPEGTHTAQASYQFIAIMTAVSGGIIAYKLVEVPLTKTLGSALRPKSQNGSSK